jgi:hypothetical protein
MKQRYKGLDSLLARVSGRDTLSASSTLDNTSLHGESLVLLEGGRAKTAPTSSADTFHRIDARFGRV